MLLRRIYERTQLLQKLLATVAFAVVGLSSLHAAERAPETHPLPLVRAWTTESGLPQNTINCIAQSHEGYLWLGTREGLARFDGARFTAFGVAEGLRNIEIQALYVDSWGRLWIGTAGGGLSRYFQGNIQSVRLPPMPGGGEVITAISGDARGRLWVGTSSGLVLLENDMVVEEPELQPLHGASIRFLMLDHTGTMWIATSGGLFEFRNNKLTLRPGPAQVSTIVAYCLLQDAKGNVWASVGNGMLLCLQGETWKVYEQADGVPFAYVTALAESGDGTIWAGSLDAGLYAFRGERFTPIRRENGLSANDIKSLLCDPEGNLWVGTRSAGLNRLSERRVTHYGLAQGLTNEFTRSVAQSTDGSLYVATIGGGLYRLSNGRFEPYPQDESVRFFASVETVLATRDGSLYSGAAGALVQMKDNSTIAVHRDAPWARFAAVRALCEDGEGGIWVGTSQGVLLQAREGQVKEVPVRLEGGAIVALAHQANGDLWIGTQAGGLKRRRPGTQELSTVEGLASQAIRALYVDQDETLWIGTAGGGLSRWRDGKLTNIGPRQGLAADTISQIVEDDAGNLWLGSTRGIFRLSKTGLQGIADGRLDVIHPRRIGRHDGMAAEECSSGSSPAALKTREGLLCFPTVQGLVVLDPQQQQNKEPVSRVLLEEMNVNGQPARIATPQDDEPEGTPVSLRISPGGGDLEVHYTAITFSEPEKLRFRYRMRGLEQNWVEAAERRVAFYQRIPPGEFALEVAVCNAEGIWSDPTTLLKVQKLPQLWQTRWFLLAATLALLGTIGGLFRIVEHKRFKQRLQRLELLHAIERERVRISQDMHDQLGGILTQVSQLSDMGVNVSNDREVQSRFTRIGTQARMAVQSLDEIIWATDPKNDNLRSFADYISRFADEFFEGTGVRCWQELPPSLPRLTLRSDMRHDVFLAVREALNNVLKHAKTREVWLRIRLEEGLVVIEVEDKGQGITPGATPGNGLSNMRTRLEQYQGRMELATRPGEGTTIRFRFRPGTEISGDI